MNKTVTCIICPRGCTVSVETSGDGLTVHGNSCPKGEKYAVEECTDPRRTVTSTVVVSNRDDVMLSVKTAEPVPKGKVFDVMNEIRRASVQAPVRIGDVILRDLYGTNVIATKNVD